MSIKELQEDHLNSAFRKGIAFSIGVHFAIVFFMTMKLFLFPSEDIIITDSIRVDIVDLPDKITEPKPVAPPQPVAKPKPVPKPKPAPKPQPKKKAVKKKPVPKKNLQNIKAEQQKAFDKLNALDALDKISQEVEEADTKPEPAKKVEYKGAAINKGNSLTGLDKIHFEEYFDKIKAHVRRNWNLPQWLANKSLSAEVIVYLDENGYVVRTEVARTSGNTVFDDTTLAAIKSSSPFPEPPSRLKSALSSGGIQFKFP